MSEAIKQAETYQRADGTTGRVWRKGSADTSSIFTGYNGHCGLCWIGATHSFAAHDEAMVQMCGK